MRRSVVMSIRESGESWSAIRLRVRTACTTGEGRRFVRFAPHLKPLLGAPGPESGHGCVKSQDYVPFETEQGHVTDEKGSDEVASNLMSAGRESSRTQEEIKKEYSDNEKRVAAAAVRGKRAI